MDEEFVCPADEEFLCPALEVWLPVFEPLDEPVLPWPALLEEAPDP